MRTRSDHASFSEAAVEIVRLLADGEWHKSIDDIHTPLRPWVSEGMFGKVKTCFMIESRREGGGPGSYYVWRLRNPRRDVMLAHLLDEGVPFDQAKAMVSALLGGEPLVNGQNGESAARPTLRAQIMRDGNPMVLHWGDFHIAAMIFASVWDSGIGPFLSNEPPDFYDDGEGHVFPARYPELAAPITPASFEIIRPDVISETPLRRGRYVLRGEHRFIDMTDGEVLHLLPEDILRLTLLGSR